MACTRNINSSANYCLEQRGHRIINNRQDFVNQPNGRAFDPAFPQLYRQGYMPADNFSFNPTDIESSLFGIGSCNLVESKQPVEPQLKELPTVAFFKTTRVIEPKTFFPLLDQRPTIMR